MQWPRPPCSSLRGLPAGPRAGVAGTWITLLFLILGSIWLLTIVVGSGGTTTQPLAWEHLEPPMDVTLRPWQVIELVPAEEPTDLVQGCHLGIHDGRVVVTPLWSNQEPTPGRDEETLILQINGIGPEQLQLAARCSALLIEAFPTLTLGSLTTRQQHRGVPPEPGFDLDDFAESTRKEQMELTMTMPDRERP